jgi:hypothetical protein
MEILKSVAVAMIVLLFAVTTNAQGPEDNDTDADLQAAKQVKDYYADWLTSIPGVSGVRVSSNRGEPQIVVDVKQMTPQIKGIPDKLNGIRVVVAPLPQAEVGSLTSSDSLEGRGLMPTPTPKVEVSPVPTPQVNF